MSAAPAPRVEPSVLIERRTPVLVVTIQRPQVRNCVDRPTAQALADAFRAFDADPDLRVAVLTGSGGHFCAGADLKAISGSDPARASPDTVSAKQRMREGLEWPAPAPASLREGTVSRANRVEATGDGPMGPTRLQLTKPVIAAISGYCVAGGIELAAWCDLRVADETAVFGVFCRRFGVPLIDGGTVRLPRLIGMSRALDLILTGRAIDAREAYQMGLVNRLAPNGQVLAVAETLAREIAEFPQACMRGDRRSAYEQWDLDEGSAIANEFRHGLDTLDSGETLAGAARFTAGSGRHGKF